VIGVFHGDVGIEGSLFEILIISEGQGGLIDNFNRPYHIKDRAGGHIGARVEKKVSHKTHGISQAGWPEDRPVDIESGSDAPQT